MLNSPNAPAAWQKNLEREIINWKSDFALSDPHCALNFKEVDVFYGGSIHDVLRLWNRFSEDSEGVAHNDLR
jgi:hypothetical protein